MPMATLPPSVDVIVTFGRASAMVEALNNLVSRQKANGLCFLVPDLHCVLSDINLINCV